MRNHPVKVLFIILFSEILLVGYSFFYFSTANPFIKEHIRFYTPASLLDFSEAGENVLADSMLQNYLANTVSDELILKRTNLSKIGPKKQNVFLINPEIASQDGRPCSKALDNFFRALLEEKDTAVVRIAHYGDSQLEGDRMSCVVRDKFHEKFGGSGVGYIPFQDIPPVSYIRKSSGNWAKNTVFHNRSRDHNYGLSGTKCRFHKYAVRQNDEAAQGDSAVSGDTLPEMPRMVYRNASVSLKMGSKYNYNTISFLYGRNEGTCIVNLYNTLTDDMIKSDTLLPCNTVCLHKLQLGAFLNIKIEFVADESPDFYGMYFDSNNGVQVDNYAIRGHSGDGLLLLSDDQLRQMLKLTNTKLVIFQYGANVVPYIHSEKVCEAIGDIYYRLFLKFKAAAPDISILVIGAGDMASGGEGGYASYKWLPRINEMQKNTALKAGCAYWDLFNMMGGANSILVWAKKNLAVTNGHFSAKGQNLVANEIVEALMIEYNNYIHRNKIIN
ncbi:MAG TPA: GDSL-type esterase/lipase family protein [Bacteroidales bacterium]|nr:GDSL-type esterase/lipase family protein [Bacteroidales bacterium]